MGNRPSNLQFLEHGKAFVAASFPRLVETWNWLVSAFDSLRGDADVNPKEGFIKVDRSDSSHPVIRLVNRDKLGGKGGGDITLTGTDESSATFNSFHFKRANDSNIEVKVTKNDEDEFANITIGVYYL